MFIMLSSLDNRSQNNKGKVILSAGLVGLGIIYSSFIRDRPQRQTKCWNYYYLQLMLTSLSMLTNLLTTGWLTIETSSLEPTTTTGTRLLILLSMYKPNTQQVALFRYKCTNNYGIIQIAALTTGADKNTSLCMFSQEPTYL